ncbi:MAG: hypothetical protein ABSG49_02395 [Methanoregula sp.]|uniref:hypothetical protein n=1 Tax=Methanoregula sp. TaxID=2052170 RepID=UPI003C2205F5
MKHTLTILLTVFIVCTLCAAVVTPVAAVGKSPIGVLTTTAEPVTLVTPEPTTVLTTDPTTIPTTVPITTEPTITVPTVVTTKPTTPPTTEPTITITLWEPTEVGGGKGYIDTYCNTDGLPSHSTAPVHDCPGCLYRRGLSRGYSGQESDGGKIRVLFLVRRDI